MTTPIERYLRELAERLPAAGGLGGRLVEEARDHLSDAASDLEAQGLPPAEAERRAVARFGSAEAVARRFREELADVVLSLVRAVRRRDARPAAAAARA